MVARACNPYYSAALETETGKAQTQGDLGQLSKTLITK